MKTKHFWLLVSSGLALFAAAPGCDDGSTTTTTSGMGSGSSSTSGSGSSSGGIVDTNVDCASADALAPTYFEGPTLVPVEQDEDFYTFDGVAGEFFQILTDAKPDTNEFDAAYPDLVITLFREDNGKWVQIARNDDPSPRYSNDSELYTILPADGKYCVRVSECSKIFGIDLCSPPGLITNPSYQIAGGTFDAATVNGIVEEKEPNDTFVNATLMEYEKASATSYYLTLGYGMSSSATDVDIYSFKVPQDQSISSGRPICNFDFFPYGVNGNGSTADNSVLAFVTSINDPTTRIAEIDMALADPQTGELPGLGFPCTFGQEYLFFLQRGPGATIGMNDFNIFTHSGSGSNPLENETSATPNSNDDVLSAETLPVQNNMDGSFSYFIEGDLTGAPGDIDVFLLDAMPGPNLATISVACGAQRLGSGLRDFSAKLLDEKENIIGMGAATESASDSLYIEQLAIPADLPTMYLQIEASGQEPSVTSSFYRCGIHLSPPSQ
ncbi:MAG TPA: hypothetical protein PK156_37565 [Polyangium sp.]|nr:hypothetical protein [Polyangium sp.]